MKATAQAHPNIALIKYWGNRDHALRLPANPSLSMNLDGLLTTTTVEFDPALNSDQLLLDGKEVIGAGLDRVSGFLDRVRQLNESKLFARVESENNFPSGAGIASSASAFAALAVAASAAAKMNLDEAQLSRLARLGSGSACRSVPGGFVEWALGTDDRSSYARSIAPADHWDLTDLIAIVDMGHKSVGSTEGHSLANTSALQAARVASAPDRLARARSAVLKRDFDSLTKVVELDSLMMHAVMMTSKPSLMYWQPATIAVMQAVIDWRRAGLSACATIDAGPNVHVLCLAQDTEQVTQRLQKISGVRKILSAKAGGPARLIET
ncbi:MAG TPA: diphosphomevalonate decarboxylase [Anaerolineae bacterium]|jgi:diphosphomevalonate decarboxylase|nr:diphosphomevalonate decarboxylase [Anaerolineae bacterium]